MAKSESSRRGRKLRKSESPADEVQQEVKAPEVDTKSRKSKKSKTSSRRSKKSQEEYTQVAFMAEGDAEEPAEPVTEEKAEAEAEAAMGDEAKPLPGVSEEQQDAIEEAIDSGNYKTEFIEGDDADDIKKMEEAAWAKTAVDARGRVHQFCDDCEELANLMLVDALKNKGSREYILKTRLAMLQSLWRFRDTSDCEDDFSIEEFHKEMRTLATVQRKLRSLDGKISALMVGADDDSSDTDGEGEAQNLTALKNARQNLRYALGDGMFAA